APGVRVTPGGSGARRASKPGPVVLDCSALWAGPLCGRLLARHGADVAKVELVGRPDGARAGPPEFWRRLNGEKREITLTADGLRAALDEADVVITAARP